MLCSDDTSIVVASGTKLVVVSTSTGTVQTTTTLSAAALAVHAALGYLAVGTDDKRLHLYQLPACTLVTSIDILKRCASLVITEVDGQVQVLVADKFAEVWAYPVSDQMKSRAFILQHPTSSITQMRVVPSLGKIFTSDQDEKIRVSHFPAAHVVSNYCLGHTAIVSSIDVMLVGSFPVLVSGGGDGTLRSWDPTTGVLLHTIEFGVTLQKRGRDSAEADQKDIDPKKDTDQNDEHSGAVVTAVTCSTQIRAVTFAVVHEGKSNVQVVDIDENGKMVLRSERQLDGTVVGMIQVQSATHVAHVDGEGIFHWSHSEPTAVARALDSLDLPPCESHNVSASAPRGERVRERQEEAALQEDAKRKKIKVEE